MTVSKSLIFFRAMCLEGLACRRTSSQGRSVSGWRSRWVVFKWRIRCGRALSAADIAMGEADIAMGEAEVAA